MIEFGGGGGNGGDIKGVQRLWANPQGGPLLQVPGESDIGGGWRLADGEPESDKSGGGLEEDDEDPKQIGGKVAGVQIFLQIPRPIGIYIWCRYVGG